MPRLIIFLISLHCILLELFFTRILNLKAWNHVVYIVIPFAMLGYGIGANLQLIRGIGRPSTDVIKKMSLLLVLTGILTIISTLIIIRIPIYVDYVITIFKDPGSVLHLLLAYTVFMIPFVMIGYIVVYLFSEFPKDTGKLYFFDLLGAGAGAFLFYPLINKLAVFPSLLLLSVLLIMLGLFNLLERNRPLIILLTGVFATAAFFWMKEPLAYNVDSRKGWECIPGYFSKSDYQETLSEWHPLGRTNLYRIISPETRQRIIRGAPATFDINLDPLPEFSYFSTNFLAGTPVYRLNEQSLKQEGIKTVNFKSSMEAPYLLLKDPRVLVIGAGGGRDIYIAKSHRAPEVLGAEINPAIWRGMSRGGVAYDYSGRIYDAPGTRVFNVDGRYISKTTRPGSLDLIVLNGVDTFSGLSSGAYAYAESYLYTKEAVKDFLKNLTPDGMINYNRWLFRAMPRETLRLQAIAFQALKESGVDDPLQHVLIGAYGLWSVTLIKKTPFTDEEIAKIDQFWQKRETRLIYPSEKSKKITDSPLGSFDLYAKAFHSGVQHEFERLYPFDVSVITDDNPFFYKYYKLSNFNFGNVFMGHHEGSVIFMTQFLILLQAIIGIVLFIFVPLFVFRRKAIQSLSVNSIGAFVLYFACLGTGFMFLEIPLMQKFVLILASPIYSIVVVLAVLLISTGLGSYWAPIWGKFFKKENELIAALGLGILLYVILLFAGGPVIFDWILHWNFFNRAAMVALLILPLGLMLGVFFPAGLKLVSSKFPLSVPWAWGINSGFGVLGGILSIIIGQFCGFNFILFLGCSLYLLSALAFGRMLDSFKT